MSMPIAGFAMGTILPVFRQTFHRRRFLAPVLSIFFLIVFTNADQRVSSTPTGPNTVQVRIDEPIVTQAVTEYPQVQFRPGDTIRIDAGGCVQTGGTGATWKRYVNPSGDNADRLYHGLVWIPGATAGPVRIAGVINRTLTIPQQVDLPGQLFLRLGYEDDGYGDNGYWGHDDGTEDQCKGAGGGPAFLTLVIDHSGSQPPTGGTSHPFDLVWEKTDNNFSPLNPRWSAQAPPPGTLPGPGLCGPPWLFPCTTQSPTINKADVCGSSGSLGGHANWGLATYEGTAFWENHSPPPTDDDYNINLVRSDQAGYTAANPDNIHTEFDSDETIDHFHTAWWQSFHSAVDSSDDAARRMIDGKAAIEIGVMGLDCAHSCGSELHPVFALAIHVKDDPADDVWAIFARNWGDEGFCANQELLVDLSSINFHLPWRSGSTSVVVSDSQFLTNSAQTSGPAVAPTAGEGVTVSFGLPAPEAGARINGEIHLRWSGQAAAMIHPHPAVLAVMPVHTFVLATPAMVHQNLEPEKRITSLVASMNPEKRRAYEELTPPKNPSFDNTQMHLVMRPNIAHVHPPPPAATAAHVGVIATATLARAPRIRFIPNSKKIALDQQRLKILKEAFPNKPQEPPPAN